jgi:hypothetical protein
MKSIVAIVGGIILALAARAVFSADATTFTVSGSNRPSVSIAPAPSARRDVRMTTPGISMVTDGLTSLFWEIVKVEQESPPGYETIFEGPRAISGQEKSYLIPFNFITKAGNVYILPGYRGMTREQCSGGNCASRTSLLHCMDLNDLAYLVSTDAGQEYVEFVPYGFVNREAPPFFGITQWHLKTLPLISTGEAYVIGSRTPESMIWEEKSGAKRITFKKRILDIDERIADCASAQ